MKSNALACSAAVSLASLFATSDASAATLLAWEFTGTNATNAPIVASTVAANVASDASSGRVNAGNGVILHNDANRFMVRDIANATATDAINGNDFISFSIAPVAGYKLSLSRLDFAIRTSNYDTDAGGNPTVVRGILTSNLTGHSDAQKLAIGSGDANNNDIMDPHLDQGTTTNAITQAYVVDLSGNTAFQNVQVPIEFRIYTFGTTSAFRRFGFSDLANVNDVVIDGSVAPIPEPASVAVLGLVTTLLMRRRIA